jgi:hypothetical protein
MFRPELIRPHSAQRSPVMLISCDHARSAEAKPLDESIDRYQRLDQAHRRSWVRWGCPPLGDASVSSTPASSIAECSAVNNEFTSSVSVNALDMLVVRSLRPSFYRSPESPRGHKQSLDRSSSSFLHFFVGSSFRVRAFSRRETTGMTRLPSTHPLRTGSLSPLIRFH